MSSHEVHDLCPLQGSAARHAYVRQHNTCKCQTGGTVQREVLSRSQRSVVAPRMPLQPVLDVTYAISKTCVRVVMFAAG